MFIVYFTITKLLLYQFLLSYLREWKYSKNQSLKSNRHWCSWGSMSSFKFYSNKKTNNYDKNSQTKIIINLF